MRKNAIKGQAGFSLVELMVVVGIIGLLAAIAVPQFSKFQARARQSESKALLASIFTGEKAFFAEWNAYTASMTNAGVGTTGNKLRYNGGVAEGANVCTGTYPTGAPADGVVDVFAASNATSSGSATFDNSGGMGTPTIVTTGRQCRNATQTFIAIVAGDPNNVAAGTFNADVWSINENKVVANVTNGIR
jgi:type IV pilus assembly protein PilA